MAVLDVVVDVVVVGSKKFTSKRDQASRQTIINKAKKQQQQQKQQTEQQRRERLKQSTSVGTQTHKRTHSQTLNLIIAHCASDPLAGVCYLVLDSTW